MKTDLFRVAHSRCCVNFLASSRSHPLNETLRRARIPDRDLGARLRRPPWVRSFCRRASSRACGSRYAAPRGSPRASFPSASAHPFPLSSFPPDRTTPRPRAASRRDHHPGNARRRPRAPQGSERCPRGPVAEHARGTRSPRRPRRDGPADPILDETRRDVEARAREKKRKSASRRTRRTNRADVPTSEPTRPTTSNRLAARTKKPLARRSPPRRSRRAAPPIAPRLRRAPRRVSAKSRAPTRCCTTRQSA